MIAEYKHYLMDRITSCLYPLILLLIIGQIYLQIDKLLMQGGVFGYMVFVVIYSFIMIYAWAFVLASWIGTDKNKSDKIVVFSSTVFSVFRHQVFLFIVLLIFMFISSALATISIAFLSSSIAPENLAFILGFTFIIITPIFFLSSFIWFRCGFGAYSIVKKSKKFGLIQSWKITGWKNKLCIRISLLTTIFYVLLAFPFFLFTDFSQPPNTTVGFDLKNHVVTLLSSAMSIAFVCTVFDKFYSAVEQKHDCAKELYEDLNKD